MPRYLRVILIILWKSKKTFWIYQLKRLKKFRKLLMVWIRKSLNLIWQLRTFYISMSSTNLERFIVILSKYITNINRALKDITDFIHKDNKELIITTNKVVATSNFNTIKNYIKNVDVVDTNKIISLRFS